MKVAVMQPYFFPYIGYWQLIDAADRFVILDDVNYITRGYINRNSILMDGKPYKFTIPIKKASQNKLILDTKLNFDMREKKRFLHTISHAYKKAPYYVEVMNLIERVIYFPEEDLTTYISNSIKAVMSYLGINTEIYISSKLEKNLSLKAEKKIIEICEKMNANVYINPSGGRQLYHHKHFNQAHIKLYFLDSRVGQIKYNQKNEQFEKNLSIIDVLMFNKIETIQKFLKEYDLNK